MKRALVIGIDDYQNSPKLKGCVKGAKKVAMLIKKNENDTLNFDCKILTSDTNKITRSSLKSHIQTLKNFKTKNLLFFFIWPQATS